MNEVLSKMRAIYRMRLLSNHWNISLFEYCNRDYEFKQDMLEVNVYFQTILHIKFVWISPTTTCVILCKLLRHAGLSWFPSHSIYCKLSNNELCLLLHKHTHVCVQMLVWVNVYVCSLKKTLITQTTFSL